LIVQMKIMERKMAGANKVILVGNLGREPEDAP
jgi:hypothetical protein